MNIRVHALHAWGRKGQFFQRRQRYKKYVVGVSSELCQTKAGEEQEC